jgi:3-dehydroquinate synthase
MKKISVNLLDRSYTVYIHRDILSSLDQYLPESQQIIVITDDNIPIKYLNLIKQRITVYREYFIPQGETSKSMEMAQLLINKMISDGVTRSALILSLGGGVVGDLAGFVASIYMRGVDYYQIPTTLLSQVDSSVGGKVGVNAIEMKNAIGAFKQPKAVFIDPNTLSTLPNNHISNGIAEIIKYGLISDKTLFNSLENKNILDSIEDIIETCIKIKAEIVTKDEKDYGIRQILNYGHTIGHAIEQDSHYSLLHGEAIAIGMAIISKKENFHNRLTRLLQKYDLPVSYNYDVDILFNYILTDKKVNKNELNIILVEEIGNGFIKTINVNEIKNYLR